MKYLLIKFFPHTRHITTGFWANRAWVPAKSLYILRVIEGTKKCIQVININQQLPLKTYWKWRSISFTHSKCIVCPHRKTVMSFVVSNRNCAIRGHISIHFEKEPFPFLIKHFILLNLPQSKPGNCGALLFQYNCVWLLQHNWIATSW